VKMECRSSFYNVSCGVVLKKLHKPKLLGTIYVMKVGTGCYKSKWVNYKIKWCEHAFEGITFSHICPTCIKENT
jgi:hypothetical protein